MCHPIPSVGIFCLTLMAISPIFAQEKLGPQLELPECDIFLFELDEAESTLSISSGKNITARPGYDNQPWFTPNSLSLLFTANGKPDRTDVYEYKISEGTTQPLTDTPTQEYSPQISPDNTTLSFVTDGVTANQSIWSKDRNKKQETWLLANQTEREPVGYYVWNHETDDILFWSRYGFSIRLVNRTEPKSHYITGHAPPSSPHIIPGTNHFSFVHRQANGETWIKELDPNTLAIRPLVAIKGANLNYGWTPGGKIIRVENDNLMWWSAESQKWQTITDLKQHGLTGVTRVAVSPDASKLAVVGQQKQ